MSDFGSHIGSKTAQARPPEWYRIAIGRRAVSLAGTEWAAVAKSGPEWQGDPFLAIRAMGSSPMLKDHSFDLRRRWTAQTVADSGRDLRR
jgi:hypothetical protein